MKLEIDLINATNPPTIGASPGFYSVGESVYCVGAPSLPGIYIGMVNHLFPRNEHQSTRGQRATPSGVTEDTLLRALAIVARPDLAPALLPQKGEA